MSAKNAQQKTVLSKNDKDRLDELTGGNANNLSDALDQWENERSAMSEMYDENQALLIYMQRAKILITSYKQIVKQLSDELALFASQKTRDRIQEFWEETRKVEEAIKTTSKFKSET